MTNATSETISNSTETPAAETEAPLTRAELSQIVNQAISSHLKRQKAPDLDALIAEKLAALTPKTDPAKEESEMERMRREHNELKAQLRAEKRASKEADLFSRLQSELSGKVKPGSENAVAKYLSKAEGVIGFDDRDQAIFRYAGEEFSSIGEVVSEFLRSPDAAHFIPAPVAKASGATKTAPRGTNPVQTQPVSKWERVEAMIRGEKI